MMIIHGINKNQELNGITYITPSNEYLTINTNRLEQIYNLQIFDLTGKEMLLSKGLKGRQLNIPLNGFNQGIYSFKLTEGKSGKFFIGKILKN